MEKSVKNAVFKGFPVLMESGPLGSKQYSQTTNEEKNNFLRSYFKVYYLVSKCTGKRVADRSAIDTALVRTWFQFIKRLTGFTQALARLSWTKALLQ